LLLIILSVLCLTKRINVTKNYPLNTPQKSKTKVRSSDAALRKKGQASSNVTGGTGLLQEAPTSKPSLLGQNKMSN
jgi:hypothetical protein